MKTSKTELTARYNKAWQDCKDFLEDHRQENGTISEEDQAIYDKMLKTVDALKVEIDRMVDIEKRDAAMNEATSKPIVATPAKGAETKTGRASDSYRKLFNDFLRGAVTKKEIRDALQEGTGSKGGYLVPEEFERRVIDKLKELDVIREYANVIRTSSKRNIPVEASAGEATWLDEEDEYEGTDPAFGLVTLDAFKVGQMIKVSDELLEDADFDLEGYLADQLASAIATAEENAFCTGNGVKKPTGIFTDNGGQVGVTTAAADKITADEIIDLVYSVKGPYRRNARFLLNDQTIKYIRKLKDGNGNYIWQPALTEGQPDRLLGYPAHSTAAPTIAAGAAVIAFGNIGYYWIADRTGVDIKRLDELFAAKGQVGFRGTKRVDGKIVQAEAIKLLKMHA
jgi:HK97 family phage major capsid protein